MFVVCVCRSLQNVHSLVFIWLLHDSMNHKQSFVSVDAVLEGKPFRSTMHVYFNCYVVSFDYQT